VGVLTCEFFGYSGRETGRLTPSWVARSRVRVYPIGNRLFPVVSRTRCRSREPVPRRGRFAVRRRRPQAIAAIRPSAVLPLARHDRPGVGQLEERHQWLGSGRPPSRSWRTDQLTVQRVPGRRTRTRRRDRAGRRGRTASGRQRFRSAVLRVAHTRRANGTAVRAGTE